MSAAIMQAPGNCECSLTCQYCPTVVDCSLAYVSGATVTITQGGTTIGTCTTDGAGQCCVTLPASGTYQATISKAGYGSWAETFSVSCPATYSTAAQISANPHRWTFTGCYGLPLPGVELTITGVGTFTSDSNGRVDLALPSGSYAWTATRPRFSAASGTKTVTACTSAATTVAMSNAAGYHCLISTCPTPMPDTLYLTDPVLGAVTLTYSGGVWSGVISVNFGGYCGCAAKAGVSVQYSMVAGSSPYGSVGVQVTTPSYCPDNTGSYFGLGLIGTTLHSCEPLSFDYTIADATCGGPLSFLPGHALWPGTGGNVTMAVTE